MMRSLRGAAFFALILSTGSFGYIRQTTDAAGDLSPVPLSRTDNTAIPFLVNSGVIAGAQSSASGKSVTVISGGSNPVAAIRNALATWNAVTTANVTFLPLGTTDAAIDSSDSKMVVAIGSTASDLSYVGGALAITVNLHLNSNGLYKGTNVAKGGIVDSDIILNPAYSFSTDGSTAYDLQSVMLHELGHALGANHSGLLGSMMYQAPISRFLTTDDLAFVNSAYPPASGGVQYGTISGTVTTAGGGGVPYALLTAIDSATGVTIGGATNASGAYSFQAPAGNYQVYAEPLNGILPINIYLTADQAALAAATQFQMTLYPGTLNVAANSTVIANIAVVAGAASLATPVVAVTSVNASPTSGYRGGPVSVPSGQSVDLILAGTGFNASLNDSNFKVYGKGISIRPGSVRLDATNTFNGFSDLRITLDVATATAPSLASFTATTSAGSISFSGALIIVPPTPTFTAAGVVSAAAYVGIKNGVSPGGIYTIYDIPGAPNLGPASYVINGPYDAYGNLPTTLAGVSVTFDGVPAPMFLSWGNQLNIQAPFEVAGKSSTKVVVNYLGSYSAVVSVPVIPVQPEFFKLSGEAVIAFNLVDHTLNTAQNPAPRGTYVEVYGTGVGKVSYPVVTGQGARGFPAGFTGNYTYTIGGAAAGAAYFGGWTPGTVGLAQWDLLVPANSTTGAASIVVTDASGATSDPGATIYVK
ncbi:MAG: matrixin family metalloprotease [Acidobacteriota bacterium]|nr:matrixin family metalloprotease [Acidobacteriota bacterium]